jgi:predicted Fe-S protein YdhL (DUF1289 family)
MSLTKRTPCVGICSTTYGDLVCRGCKRFAHEIVQWNGYDDLQQEAVRERLQRVRDEVLSLLLVCHDEALLQNALSDAGLQDLDLMEAQYQLLRFMVRREQPLASVGLALAAEAPALATPLPAQADKVLDTLYLMQLLDSETFQRAKAHYERNFKVPA